MKKAYTSEFHGKNKMQNELSRYNPRKSTLNLLKQFARTFTVEKTEKGKTVNLFLN
ncbi:MAG: hypothetical protein Q8909_14520 [Bacteroidota bacterium]|nr:hypothetical protein [Bacteroidota bacterium]